MQTPNFDMIITKALALELLKSRYIYSFNEEGDPIFAFSIAEAMGLTVMCKGYEGEEQGEWLTADNTDYDTLLNDQEYEEFELAFPIMDRDGIIKDAYEQGSMDTLRNFDSEHIWDERGFEKDRKEYYASKNIIIEDNEEEKEESDG